MAHYHSDQGSPEGKYIKIIKLLVAYQAHLLHAILVHGGLGGDAQLAAAAQRAVVDPLQGALQQEMAGDMVSGGRNW